jgi:hypothetical protein
MGRSPLATRADAWVGIISYSLYLKYVGKLGANIKIRCATNKTNILINCNNVRRRPIYYLICDLILDMGLSVKLSRVHESRSDK